MSQKTKAIPSGYHTITPFVCLKGAAKAIDFYKAAFEAKELEKHLSADGRIMHAVIKIGDSLIMIADEFPEHGGKMSAPHSLSGIPVMFHLYVEDADAVFNQAVKMGAIVEKPMEDVFWGDRYGQIRDPFGYHWSVATHKVDVTPEQQEEAAKKLFCNPKI